MEVSSSLVVASFGIMGVQGEASVLVFVGVVLDW